MVTDWSLHKSLDKLRGGIHRSASVRLLHFSSLSLKDFHMYVCVGVFGCRTMRDLFCSRNRRTVFGAAKNGTFLLCDESRGNSREQRRILFICHQCLAATAPPPPPPISDGADWQGGDFQISPRVLISPLAPLIRAHPRRIWKKGNSQN